MTTNELDHPYGQQDRKEFAWLLRQIAGAKSILEIGSCFGQSLRMFAAACPGAKIRSIDHGGGKNWINGFDTASELKKAVGDLRNAGHDAREIFADSHDPAAIEWAKAHGPYDFVFIDAGHDYNDVLQDWTNYSPLGKLVGLHDIDHPTHGTREMWHQIKILHPDTDEYIRSYMGVGVVHMQGRKFEPDRREKLSIVLATRCRPGILVRTVNTTLANIVRDDTRLVLSVDDDDHGTIGLRDVLRDHRIMWSIEPRPDTVAEKFNRVMRVAPADAYMVMVDYAPCVTKGFDDEILEAARVYPDGYAFIINHLANRSFSQMNAVTHKLATKLGGIYPEHFPYWFVDHWFEDLSKQIDRRVFVDVMMDCSNKQPTMGLKEPDFWSTLFDWLCIERRRIARDIITAPDFYEVAFRKAAILRNQELVREESCRINEGVREDVRLGRLPSEPVSADDERYIRIRQKAMALMEKYMPELEAEGVITRVQKAA